MTQLYVARRKRRHGFYIPMDGTPDNPSLMFFLPQGKGEEVSKSQLDELIRSQLEKVGITKESDIQDIINKAENDYELRVKVEEVKKEIRRLMAIRAEGGKLMSSGFRKWRQAFYPSIKR